MDDLLGAPRENGSEQLRPARLSGIRELYMMLTGDYDLHGGYHPERVHLATTADFTGLVKNALNKIVVNRWEELGRAGYDWWEQRRHGGAFQQPQPDHRHAGGHGGRLCPVCRRRGVHRAGGGRLAPRRPDFTKYGGYIPLTLELIDRDETRKLRGLPARAGHRRAAQDLGAGGGHLHANAGVGPTLADSGALFNNTAVTTAGGHANLLTTALSAAEWEVVCSGHLQPAHAGARMRPAYYGTGPKMAINPRYLLVPRALQLTAMKILYPTLENAANIYSENLQQGPAGRRDHGAGVDRRHRLGGGVRPARGAGDLRGRALRDDAGDLHRRG